MVSATVCQLKTVVVYWQLAVVKDAKFWLLNPNDLSRNQRRLETAGFFVLNLWVKVNRLAGKFPFLASVFIYDLHIPISFVAK